MSLLMQFRIGYEFTYYLPQDVPMILLVNVHYSRASDMITPDHLTTDPSIPVTSYRDAFGNWCSRLLAPAGPLRLRTDAVVKDHGFPDLVVPEAAQHLVEHLPEETLVFLLGSRYCETDLLTPTAWQLFESTPPGWARVQAICDFVHDRITFDYQSARPTRSAAQAYDERIGVCRDYAHLAIALCRCMNIPARYCTGYLSDIGTPQPWAIGDFAAWMEVYLGGRWHTFDPRNNEPRIGRVLIAQGRDASDVPITQTFGPNTLVSFKVWTDEIPDVAAKAS
jgi:transglutaminase-like putative cysteine protease